MIWRTEGKLSLFTIVTRSAQHGIQVIKCWKENSAYLGYHDNVSQVLTRAKTLSISDFFSAEHFLSDINFCKWAARIVLYKSISINGKKEQCTFEFQHWAGKKMNPRIMFLIYMNPMADFTETGMILSWFFWWLRISNYLYICVCVYICISFFSIRDLFYILRSVHFILCILCPKKKNVKTWEKSLIQTLCFDQPYLKRCLPEMKSHTFQ